MTHHFAQADALHLPLADMSVNLVVCSPPYIDARLYLENGKNLGIARKCEAWIEWMLLVVEECLRVTDGPVIVVAASKTDKRNYQPACGGLMYLWWANGGHAYRLDPFSGSGTTVDAVVRCGRRGIGFDLRMSQCLLGRRRMNEPVPKPRARKAKPVDREQNMFVIGAA